MFLEGCLCKRYLQVLEKRTDLRSLENKVPTCVFFSDDLPLMMHLRNNMYIYI